MPVAYTLDPQLGWVPAIPEPFWYKSWRTWFCYVPACYQCPDALGNPLLFKNRAAWDAHYVLTHLEEDTDESHEE
jgi:hypothetical protein